MLSMLPNWIETYSKEMSSYFLVLFWLALSCRTGYAINPDGTALLSFVKSMSPDAQPLFNSWNEQDLNPCVGWLGVSCTNVTGTPRVVNVTLTAISTYGRIPAEFGSLDALQYLTLSGLNLTGTIPTELANCSQLVVLDLGGNGVSGIIPPEIGRLSNLQELLLNDNDLNGNLPLELGLCSRLEMLYFYQNNISGIVPSTLGNLSSLVEIRGGGNVYLGGPIPPELGNLQNLTVLGLAVSSISGTIPLSLAGLKKLQNLGLYKCNLAGTIPPELSQLTSLQSMYLHSNNLTGSIPRELGNLTQLTVLYLWNNNLTGTIPPELANCTFLQVLELSFNNLTGGIPSEFGRLTSLQQILLSNNSLLGNLPTELGNLSSLLGLQLDSNLLYGTIPVELGLLTSLETLYLWNNNFIGEIPVSLGNCKELMDLDVSFNLLTGNLPREIFFLPNLLRLRVIVNNLSGQFPHEIGQSKNLTRIRISSNAFGGNFPPEIGQLENLIFFDFANNFFTGPLPKEFGNCSSLELLDAHNNEFSGSLPAELAKLSSLQTLDLSNNQLEGPIPPELGDLRSLSQLILSANLLSGFVPSSVAGFQKLELLNISRNRLSGVIPPQLGNVVSLVIGLDLSYNLLSGPIPQQLAQLLNLQLLDLSHNDFSGSLAILGQLDSLSILNVSYNDFSGHLPDTYFFRTMPASSFAGNPGLCTLASNNCTSSPEQLPPARESKPKGAIAGTPLVVSLLFGSAVVILCVGSFLFYERYWVDAQFPDEDHGPWPWRLTPFQKLNFTLGEVLDSLVEKNVVGSGCSGIVYKAEMDGGEVIAVKKLRPVRKGDTHQNSFAAEIDILGGIRHRNIVRLLGYCSNNDINLLMYDYMPNGSLGEVLHEKKRMLDWEARYNIAVGAAQGLAYLHHDCLPAILHRDVKSNNILLGSHFEPYVADFGLAKLIDASNASKLVSKVAGSYGYIAPEYGYTLKITDKSDVYSYGVVVLEILTGRKAVEPGFGENWHIVKWVQETMNLSNAAGNLEVAWEVIDSRLRGMPDSFIQEMTQTLGVALLCVHSVPGERPTMKEVVALLLEVKHDMIDDLTKPGNLKSAKNSSSLRKTSS